MWGQWLLGFESFCFSLRVWHMLSLYLEAAFPQSGPRCLLSTRLSAQTFPVPGAHLPSLRRNSPPFLSNHLVLIFLIEFRAFQKVSFANHFTVYLPICLSISHLYKVNSKDQKLCLCYPMWNWQCPQALLGAWIGTQNMFVERTTGCMSGWVESLL